MAAKDFKVDRLLLDSENPRIGTADSQRDAMQKILDDDDKKLFALAESIADEGISPLERLLVIREAAKSDRYIVLDGNRRLTALKFLTNPHLLGDLNVKERLLKRFQDLASKFALSGAIPCYVVADRSAGATWIYRRHIGQDQGRGVVTWSGIAKARFKGTDPSLQALDFVMKFGNLTTEQVSGINAGFPISTLKRLLDTPAVRALLGLKRESGDLTSGLPPDELIKPLRRIVLDLLDQEIVVTDVKLVDQQVKYVKGLDAHDKPDLKLLGKSRPINEIAVKDFTNPASKPTRKKRVAHDPSQRPTVIPKRLRLNFSHENRPAAIYNELQKLRAEDACNAGSVLLRVFLELSVDCYMQKHAIEPTAKVPDKKGGFRTVDKSLRAKVREVIEDLVAKGADKRHFAAVVRGLDSTHSPFSIELLNDYVHNRFVTPKPNDVKTAWNDSQAFFQGLWA